MLFNLSLFQVMYVKIVYAASKSLNFQSYWLTLPFIQKAFQLMK